MTHFFLAVRWLHLLVSERLFHAVVSGCVAEEHRCNYDLGVFVRLNRYQNLHELSRPRFGERIFVGIRPGPRLQYNQQ